MKHIGTDQDGVTEPSPWREPTDADLYATELEMPVVLAEVDQLDVEISLVDRPSTAFDERRLRRAGNRVLAARRDLANFVTDLTVRLAEMDGAA